LFRPRFKAKKVASIFVSAKERTKIKSIKVRWILKNQKFARGVQKAESKNEWKSNRKISRKIKINPNIFP
jgi:hypothetical protein